nr:hypothetical protein GCM10023233_01980 [Brevibacterium otitidis]
MSEIHERCERLSGADVVAELKASGALDGLFARIDAGEIELTGDGGMISVLIREALERGLQAEMTSHLGYEVDRPGYGGGFDLTERIGTCLHRVSTLQKFVTVLCVWSMRS